MRLLSLDDDGNFVATESSDWISNIHNGSVTFGNNIWKEVQAKTIATSGKYHIESTVTIRGTGNCSTRYMYNSIAVNSVAGSNRKANSLGQIKPISASSVYDGSTIQYVDDFVAGDIISAWCYCSVVAGTIAGTWTTQLIIQPWGGS